MAEEFEGDMTGSVFWGADLSGARFRDVNLVDVTISHAMLVNVDVDAYVDRVVINGVDVTGYVNERDEWYPLRAMLQPTEPDGMRAAWHALQEAWFPTMQRAQQLTDGQLHESVGGEWSFAETLRHLVFAMDKWFTVPILGQEFSPMGLPNTGSRDFGWPGVDLDANPSYSEVLQVRAGRIERFSEYLAALTADALPRDVDVLENGRVTVKDCVNVVFEEEFWHLRYAIRDLEQLT